MDGDMCLSNLAGGALEEKYQECFAQVLRNMTDVNTPYAKKREIIIKLTYEQNESRTDIGVTVAVSAKLAPVTPAKTNFGLFKDLRTQKITVQEYGSQLKGQTRIDDDSKFIEVAGVRPEGEYEK